MSSKFKKNFYILVEHVQVVFGTWLVWLGFKILRGFAPEIWRHQKVSDKRQLDILRAMFKQDILSGNIELRPDMIPAIRENVKVLNKAFKFEPPLGPDEVFAIFVEAVREINNEGLLKAGEERGLEPIS